MEQGIVDVDEYMKLENDVYIAANNELPEREKHKKAVRFGIISTSVLTAIVSHQTPDNDYEIKNYKPDDLHKLLNRMHQVLDGFSDGKMPNRAELEEIVDA